MHSGTPTSVPFPLLVFAVGVRVGTELQPLPDGTVALHRSEAEAHLSASTRPDAILIEQRILPWRPADETKHASSTSSFEYTVGYSKGDHHIPMGLSFSTDRAVIETELAHVQAAIAESIADQPVAAVLLERPINPWFPARLRPTTPR